MRATKGMVEKLKEAGSLDDVANIDKEHVEQNLQEINGEMQNSKEQERQKKMQEQQLKQMKKHLDQMEQQVKQFERILTKIKVTPPAKLTETIAKIKEIIAKARAATTMDEWQAAGVEDIRDLFDSLQESRGQLEMLARWPQTLKQVDVQLKRLNNELAKAKKMVTKVSKDIDLTSTYSSFEEVVGKLKLARDNAVAKVEAGAAEEAFQLLQDDFFGQLDDIFKYQRTIQMMSNLGKFKAEFQRGVAQLDRRIKKLERNKKIDVTEIRQLQADAKVKGEQIIDILKAGGDLDEDTIFGLMQEMESLRSEIEASLNELEGDNSALPWNQGKQQFGNVNFQVPTGFGGGNQGGGQSFDGGGETSIGVGGGNRGGGGGGKTIGF